MASSSVQSPLVESDSTLSDSVRNNVNVTVCCQGYSQAVSGLIHYIEQNMTDVVESVNFESLPYNINEMDEFDLRRVDVLLLCHSIKNRRYPITDVTGALYDSFLYRAMKHLGKSKVGVIVHDYFEKDLSPDKVHSRMSRFRQTQPTTFQCASLVLIGGQLSHDPVQLTHEQLEELRRFLCAEMSLTESVRVMSNRLSDCYYCILCDCCERCVYSIFCCKKRRYENLFD
ncbi:uncharacterized protein LOC121405610 [Lytechinus variegatus]|uniref:uncharacterized protein LOC121405610 n=1 Tax=Lytechinus variegatus TaxID=7654 RepID=UPI001BB264C1|nr:uncharacterized protein LOC121405610 [Lytechinus variegatus]